MGRQRFTAESIVRKLREAEVDLSRGQMLVQACKKISVCEQSIIIGVCNTTLNARTARPAIIHRHRKQSNLKTT